MAKADVLTLIQDLSSGQADAAAIDRFYDDVIRDLGQRPWLAQATLIAITAGTTVYTPATSVIRILDVYYDDHVLRKATKQELESTNAQWRDEHGTPIVHITEDESAKDFRLYPNPEVSSKDFIFLFGSPFGLDYPEYAVAIVHTETRINLPAWLEMPVAFEILRREFMRESDHKDTEFAGACGQLADLLFLLVT